MSFFFESKNLSISLIKNYYDYKKGDLLYISYYDQYKNYYTLEGKCVLKKKSVNGDIFLCIYNKSRGLYFSFFQNSPLIISIFKKV